MGNRITENALQGCVIFDPGGQAIPSLGCLTQVIVNVIQILLMFLGVIAILFIFYAALRFILSRGDPKAIQNAQKTLTYAVLGTILIVLAYAIISIFTSSFGLPLILQNFGIYQGP